MRVHCYYKLELIWKLVVDIVPRLDVSFHRLKIRCVSIGKVCGFEAGIIKLPGFWGSVKLDAIKGNLVILRDFPSNKSCWKFGLVNVGYTHMLHVVNFYLHLA